MKDEVEVELTVKPHETVSRIRAFETLGAFRGYDWRLGGREVGLKFATSDAPRFREAASAQNVPFLQRA